MAASSKSTSLPLLLLFPFFLALSAGPAQAQSLPGGRSQVELGASLALSGPLRIHREYGPQESDIGSSGSPGFEFHLGLSRPLSGNTRWMAGAAFGAYSYRIDLNVADQFNRLGWGGYSDRYTHFEILYASLLGGLRVDFPIREQGLLFLQPALRATYHLRSHSELAVYAIPETGGVRQLFQAEMINNDGNKLILSPELGLFYQLSPGGGRWGLICGVNAVYSKAYPFSGDFQIIGDKEVLEGSLEKRFLHAGVSLSFFWRLDE